MRMHADEVAVDVALARSLLEEQFPELANLPLTAMKTTGTDNALFRLGEDMLLRLPKIHWAAVHVEKEHAWLPRLAPLLPLPIPEPLCLGAPGVDYPFPWSVYRRLEGDVVAPEEIPDPNQAARDIAGFIKALRGIDFSDGPPLEENSRGRPLRIKHDAVREAIRKLAAMIDVRKALSIWRRALEASPWSGKPMWFHGDMLIGNILFARGRVSAIIDFGGMGRGDPACDCMIAWSLFSDPAREAFRDELNPDEAAWMRGPGHALAQALIFIPYYVETNPTGVAYAKRMLRKLGIM